MYRKLVEDKIFCDSEGAINNHANKGAILCIILIENQHKEQNSNW